MRAPAEQEAFVASHVVYAATLEPAERAQYWDDVFARARKNYRESAALLGLPAASPVDEATVELAYRAFIARLWALTEPDAVLPPDKRLRDALGCAIRAALLKVMEPKE